VRDGGKQGGEEGVAELLHDKFDMNAFILSASGRQKPHYWGKF